LAFALVLALALALALAQSPFRWRNTTIDLWSRLPNNWRTSLTNGAVKDPRNGFFLHDCVSHPKAVIIHYYHKMSLLYPCENYLAIMIRTSCPMLIWNTLYKRRPDRESDELPISRTIS
jgi:hypothetical protein